MKQKNYENYLNDLFNNEAPETVFENHVYLTNKSRGKFVSEKRLKAIIQKGEVGTLLRRLDPIAFSTGMRDANI